jgi:hypothetical protein
MKGVFCLLDNDEKNYNYVKEYFKIIRDSLSPVKIDAAIQKNEIERCLKLEGIDPDDCRKVCDWIGKYSSSIRSYLNSLKMLALSIYLIEEGLSLPPAGALSFEIFCRAVNSWNERKEALVDSIFI